MQSHFYTNKNKEQLQQDYESFFEVEENVDDQVQLAGQQTNSTIPSDG